MHDLTSESLSKKVTAEAGLKLRSPAQDAASPPPVADGGRRCFGLEGWQELCLTCPEVLQADHETTAQVAGCEEDVA